MLCFILCRWHDAQKARRVCCAMQGRLAVFSNRATQSASLLGITLRTGPVCPHAFGPSSRQTASLPSPMPLWPANRQSR